MIKATQDLCMDGLILGLQTTEKSNDIPILTLLLHTRDIILEWLIHVPLLKDTHDLRIILHQTLIAFLKKKILLSYIIQASDIL
jgi:hypothetical protein